MYYTDVILQINPDKREGFMKRILTLLVSVLCLMQITALPATAYEANIIGQQEYKPLDIVVVFDISDSMNVSDAQKLTPHAVKILTDMMFEKGGRIGIVVFNTVPKAFTTDSSGNPALIALSDTSELEQMFDTLSMIEYRDGTGIGNALLAAAEMLEKNTLDEERQKVILLFTDGVDDFGKFPTSAVRMADCKTNQAAAVEWAAENDCPIYCVGYDFEWKGTHSMGENGEGLKKLEDISKETGGVVKKASNVSEIEELFLDMIAKIGGGAIYSLPVSNSKVQIYVTPEVVEANIRIRSLVDSAIIDGKVELFNPKGEKVVLQKSDTLKYNVDALGATLKLINPEQGTWMLALEGVRDDDVKVSYLLHYELGMDSVLVLPKENPEGVAYIGDVIQVQTYLTKNGEKLENEDIYKEITNAQLIVTPRAHPENKTNYALSLDGSQFTGSFEILEDSVYDVIVNIESDSFFRSDLLTIQSSNQPLQLVGNIEDTKVNNRQRIEVADLYSYVSDLENDPITAEVSWVSDPEMLTARVDNDRILIAGTGWGAANVTVTFTDAQGNEVKDTFFVKVNDPLAITLIILSIFLFVLAILLLMYISYRKSFTVKGSITVKKIAEVLDDSGVNPRFVNVIYTDPSGLGSSSNAGSLGGLGSATGASPLGGGLGSSSGADPLGGGLGSSSGASPLGGGLGSSSGASPLGGGLGSSTGASPLGGGLGSASEFSTEAFDERKHHSGFKGEMNLKFALAKEKHFYKVLVTFMNNYDAYMTLNGKQNSEMSKNVKVFICNCFHDFDQVEVKGTAFGQNGFILKFPQKGSRIRVFSPRKVKNLVHVCPVNGNRVFLAFSVPTDNEYMGNQVCAYIELEYKK